MIETLITIVIVLIAIILTPFAMMIVVMFIGFIMMPFEHIKLKRKGKR